MGERRAGGGKGGRGWGEGRGNKNEEEISSFRRMREGPEGQREGGLGVGGDGRRRQAQFLIRTDHSQQLQQNWGHGEVRG